MLPFEDHKPIRIYSVCPFPNELQNQNDIRQKERGWTLRPILRGSIALDGLSWDILWKNGWFVGVPPFQETSIFKPIPQVKLTEPAQGWASELADFCDQQQGDAHKLKASPARRTEDGLKHELTHSPVSSGGFSFIPTFFWLNLWILVEICWSFGKGHKKLRYTHSMNNMLFSAPGIRPHCDMIRVSNNVRPPSYKLVYKPQ